MNVKILSNVTNQNFEIQTYNDIIFKKKEKYAVILRFWNRGFWNNLDSGMGFAADQN